MIRKLVYVILLSLAALHGYAQAPVPPPLPLPEDTDKPYLKYPGLPAFNVREMDSITIFNTFNIPKGKPVALILFDPDCKHCKNTVKRLTEGMDSVKDIQFYLVTLSRNFQSMRRFYDDYHLGDYKNIALVGQDYEFFFLSFYKCRNFPVVALYDKHKKFLDFKEGEFSVQELYDMLHRR